MNNYLNKFFKFSLLILILIGLAQAVAFFDPKNETRNQVGFNVFKAKMALAQFFFPRYPERLKYVVGELNQASEQLVYFNGELKNLTNQCNCKNVQSQCSQTSTLGPFSKRSFELNPPAFKIEELDPGATIKNVGNEIDRVKQQVINSVNSLEIYLVVTKQNKVSQIEEKKFLSFATLFALFEGEGLFEKYKEEITKELEGTETKAKFNLLEIKEIENQLQNLKNFNDTLGEAKNKLERVEQEIKQSLKIDDLSKIKGSLEKYQAIQGLLEGYLDETRNDLKQKLNQITELPDQLKNKLNQITEDLKQQITSLPDTIKSMLTPTSCKAVSPETFGEPCPQRKEIERTQIEIQNKIDQISFLRELLQKEMESGLKAELETLREDEATQLENGLNDILASSKNIISSANANLDILNDEQYAVEKQCSAECERGISFNLQACLLENLGEQNAIEIIFEVGASLKELELGEIGIKDISLNLPEKLELGDIAGIKDFKIPLSDITINIAPTPVDKWQDLSLQPIVFHPPLPDLPKLPWLNFSCPKIDAKNYQCLGEEEKSANAYIELEWYLQTFSWLSEKCQEIPGLKDQYGMPSNECFDKENVHLTILRQCDIVWQNYFACLDDHDDCPPPPGICASLGSPGPRTQAQQRECQNLFKKVMETIPQPCNLTTLETKCSQIKEKLEGEIPEPCKFLPLFTKKFEKPKSQSYQETPTNCPSQIISDAPLTGIRLDCPLSSAALFAGIPKIQLPDIIIPDIRLPSFSYPPFLKVKLPSFIFEDLILSDLLFCNLDDCLGAIPPLELNIPYPILRIPAIELPPIFASIPGIPGLEAPKSPLKIEMGRLELPPIPIPLIGLDLTKLITLNLQLPEIPLPVPEILLNLKGIDIDVMDLLLGLVSKIIPLPSGCIGVGIDFIPLVIGFSDYYFYWPAFPEIPDLCNNEYVSINDFCRDIKDTLKTGEVVKKVNEIQALINQAIEEDIQTRLDEISALFEELINEYVSENLEEISAKIEKEIEKNIQKALVKLKYQEAKEKLLEIGPIEVPLDDISIPMEKINAKLSKIPKEIKIPWPEKLKTIKLPKSLTYQLPPIPLEDLNYKKEIPLKVPGFQFPSYNFSIDFLGNYPSCEGQDPSGGNPYPIDRINVNLGEILNLNQEINQARESINQVLR